MEKKMNRCDDCMYFYYDEDYEDYVCGADMDEDDYARMMQRGDSAGCPYWKTGDEYTVVRHQM